MCVCLCVLVCEHKCMSVTELSERMRVSVREGAEGLEIERELILCY